MKNLVKEFDNKERTKVFVVNQDITKVSVDTLIACVEEKDEDRISGIDQAIKLTSAYYYRKLKEDHPVLKKTASYRFSKVGHQGEFNHMVFVPNQKELGLDILIELGLMEAKEMNSKSVAIPIFRLNQLKSLAKEEMGKNISHLVCGLHSFLHYHANKSDQKEFPIKEVYFVVLDNEEISEMLKRNLNALPKLKKEKKKSQDILSRIFNQDKEDK